MFLTITRRACAQINHMALDCLFPGQCPLARLPTDPESNMGNYIGSRMIGQDPMWTPIHVGARVILTKNLNKITGFVNGMGAKVVEMGNAGVFVETDQGRRIMVHPWSLLLLLCGQRCACFLKA